MPRKHFTRDDLTAEFVRSVLDYDPATGVLTWRKRTDISVARGRRAAWNTMYAGKPAGTERPIGGYVSIIINSRPYLAHRLAWLMTYGEWPAADIDHINGDASDNSIANLRAATRSQNNANLPKRRDNTSGFKGVEVHHTGRFSARIRYEGQRRYLGLYDTPEEAHEAYCRAARELFGEFARFD